MFSMYSPMLDAQILQKGGIPEPLDSGVLFVVGCDPRY